MGIPSKCCYPDCFHCPYDDCAMDHKDIQNLLKRKRYQNNPEKYIEKQTAEAILRFSRELDETKQQLFTMRLNGMSFKDIGAALGKTENWARVTFFRVRNEILDRLEGEQ